MVDTDLDVLITKKFVSYREDIVAEFRKKHPYIVGVLEKVLANQETRVGVQVAESGQVIGEYTFVLAGINISGTKQGLLDSYVKHPILGIVIKPYIVLEKSEIEKIIGDTSYRDDLFAYITNLLPKVTLKFMP